MTTSESAYEIPAAPHVAEQSQARTAQAPRGPQSPRPPKIDDSKLSTTYANFCRVTGTPEELLVDFGLNAQPLGETDDAIVVTQRVVLNYFTAKRLLQALGMSVARHEQVFGPLETDVLKRAAKQ